MNGVVDMKSQPMKSEPQVDTENIPMKFIMTVNVILPMTLHLELVEYDPNMCRRTTH